MVQTSVRVPKKKVVTRVDITAETVKKATARAAARAAGVTIWADKKSHYLMIRQRGGAADWIVKTRGKTRVIGDVREHRRGLLSVRSARDKAATLYGQIADGQDPREPAPVKATTWMWSDLDREYQAMIAKPRWVNRRMKRPKKGTADDVRLAFAREPLQDLHPRLLTELDRAAFDGALQKIESHRQREKCAAYVKAAFNWAAEKQPAESGLTEDTAPVGEAVSRRSRRGADV